MESRLSNVCFFIVSTVLLSPASEGAATVLQAFAAAQIFTSPGFPQNYPSNTEVFWQVSTSGLDTTLGSWVVNMELVSFSVEPHSSCAYDFLEVFDGPSNTAESLGQICGNQGGLSYSSTGTDLYVRFFSDFSLTDTGFEIRYWATYTAFAIVTKPPVSNKTDPWIIIGGVLGGFAFICLFGLFVYLCYRRKKSRTKKVTRKVITLLPDGSISHGYRTSLKIKKVAPEKDDKRNDSRTGSPWASASSSHVSLSTSGQPVARWNASHPPHAFKYSEPSYPMNYGYMGY